MKEEKDNRQARIRFRFCKKEIEKHAGKDIPDTVIKQWINYGRSIEYALSSYEKATQQLAKEESIRHLTVQLKNIEKVQNQTQKMLESFIEVSINLSRVFLITSTTLSGKLSTLTESDHQLARRFDKAFNSITSELFPEIKNDFFIKILTNKDNK